MSYRLALLAWIICVSFLVALLAMFYMDHANVGPWSIGPTVPGYLESLV